MRVNRASRSAILAHILARMQIPRFWAQVRLRHQTGLRHGFTVQRWGWSDENQLAAQAHAKARAQEALDLLLQPPEQRRLGRGFQRIEHTGTYGLSGETPIREEILEQRGQVVKTRNSYGAHCLNTPDVAIADVDFAPPLPEPNALPLATLAVVTLGWYVLCMAQGWVMVAWVSLAVAALLALRMVKRWLAVRKAHAQRRDPKLTAVEQVTAFSQQHPDWGLRVYNTPKGLRVIVTHRTMRPADNDVQKLFAALQVDPLYARLCERQQCFRARVSGKPWRMGINGPSEAARRWPVAEPYIADRWRWNKHYDEHVPGFSACQFVSQLGVQAIAADVQPLLDWHDEACRAHQTTLPMA